MKILVRLPNWVGDIVMSTAFLTAVKQLYPEAQVDVIIKKELSSIAPLLPSVNKVYGFSKQDFNGLSGLYRFGKSLRSEQYDVFFCLPDSLSSAVMGWATGAEQRVGFGKEGRFFLLTHSLKKPLGLHRTDEYISLIEQFTAKPVNDRRVQLAINEERENLIIINFNSEAVSRRMPVDKGIHLLQKLASSFMNVRLLLVGSPKDVAFIDQIIASVPSKNVENYVGKTDLIGLTRLMANAKAVLTTDSGPAHLANAVGTPTIVLFGAGNEENTAPYNKENITVIRAGKLSCEPCVRNTCKLYGIPKCMEMLDECRIINALSLYLKHD